MGFQSGFGRVHVITSNLTGGRRTFLRLCTGAVVGLISLLIAIPAIGYMLAPLRRRQRKAGEENFIDMGPLADLTPDTWLMLPLDIVRQDGWEEVRQRHSVYVRRHGDTAADVIVLSPICPHLGCPISWDQQKSQFLCPCHGGTYTATGAYAGGPPPRSMDPLPFEIRDGHLMVQWQDFKIGVAQRIPVEV